MYDIGGYTSIRNNRAIGKGVIEGKHWKRRLELERENVESIWIEFFPAKAKSFLICTKIK